jgi:hypothetical protein
MKQTDASETKETQGVFDVMLREQGILLVAGPACQWCWSFCWWLVLEQVDLARAALIFPFQTSGCLWDKNSL